MRTEDIVNKAFARSFMGYDVEQVDRFLDEVIECFERYESEKKEMLIAMEYLLGKLENGRKLPLTEMRKAIASGKPAKKRAPSAERTEKAVERADEGESGANWEKADERARAARAVPRGKTAAAPMQARAPKVQRVLRGESERAEPSAREAAPAKTGGDWFDELLVNLCERERQGFAEPEQAAKQPGDAAAAEEETPAATRANGDTKENAAPESRPDESGDAQ